MSDSQGEPEAWWFNSKTNEVEFGRLAAALDRIGPFDNKQDAERALEIVSDRAADWRAEEENDS